MTCSKLNFVLFLKPPREGEPTEFDDFDPFASRKPVDVDLISGDVDFFTTVEYQSPSEPFPPNGGDLLGKFPSYRLSLWGLCSPISGCKGMYSSIRYDRISG